MMQSLSFATPPEPEQKRTHRLSPPLSLNRTFLTHAMKSLTLSFAATTLLSLHVAALPSQNGVALVGPGQFVESSSLDVLEKRAP